MRRSHAGGEVALAAELRVGGDAAAAILAWGRLTRLVSVASSVVRIVGMLSSLRCMDRVVLSGLDGRVGVVGLKASRSKNVWSVQGGATGAR